MFPHQGEIESSSDYLEAGKEDILDGDLHNVGEGRRRKCRADVNDGLKEVQDEGDHAVTHLCRGGGGGGGGKREVRTWTGWWSGR